ncbi:methyltransferase domain-containing protein [Polyangium sp. 6x1]|uniref:class I SAM-dependent methyltransferase n=1 Tax=Polyangium sp. 6x1 TaxID=3042689 RepID=UPI002482778D|nr:methyltransferase domain-containing protein [Polyangium sp. 6x1]MDI1450703.1 methyltransferase domain-containing protein [Polyangium sp. 6x1]
MFVDESAWIRDVLAGTEFPKGATVLDIGSSTLHFRTVVQPHLDRNVFAPLRARGLQVLHLDARPEPGVDIVADVTNLKGVERTFDLVLCTNLLEHVTDREATLRHVARVVAPGGLLVLTVPRRYPIHRDPIDTGYRPTAAELVALLGWPEVLRQEVLTIRAPEHYQGWKRALRRIFSPWQIACVLARKPG